MAFQCFVILQSFFSAFTFGGRVAQVYHLPWCLKWDPVLSRHLSRGRQGALGRASGALCAARYRGTYDCTGMGVGRAVAQSRSHVPGHHSDPFFFAFVSSSRNLRLQNLRRLAIFWQKPAPPQLEQSVTPDEKLVSSSHDSNARPCARTAPEIDAQQTKKVKRQNIAPFSSHRHNS